jgi:hypothetical protein
VVARIAGRVVGEHEDDIRVGYAEAFHGSIPALFVSSWAYHSKRTFKRERVAHIPNAFAICYPNVLSKKTCAVDQ